VVAAPLQDAVGGRGSTPPPLCLHAAVPLLLCRLLPATSAILACTRLRLCRVPCVLVQMGWAKMYPVMGYSDPIRIGLSIGFIFFGYLLDTYPPRI
jgi:hypothetical protein